MCRKSSEPNNVDTIISPIVYPATTDVVVADRFLPDERLNHKDMSLPYPYHKTDVTSLYEFEKSGHMYV